MEKKIMKNTKVATNKAKKTWLDLSEKQLRDLNTKSACMYGRKSKHSIM